MNSDFNDLLVILDQEDVRYLVVGGYAVIFHSQPRYTKDLDIWVQPSAENAERLMKAFARFGVSMFGLTKEDFETKGTQLNIGIAPVAIDFLTSISDLDFDIAWSKRVDFESENLTIHYLSKDDLISAKRSAARLVDLADIEELERTDT